MVSVKRKGYQIFIIQECGLKRILHIMMLEVIQSNLYSESKELTVHISKRSKGIYLGVE